MDSAIKAATASSVAQEVKATWPALAGDKKGNGVELMMRLFSAAPKSVSYFERLGDVSPAVGRSNRKLIGHGTTLMYGLMGFVEQLDDPATMEDVARKFAVKHVDRNVLSTQFKLALEPLLSLLQDRLGKRYNDKTRDAWTKMINVVACALDEEEKERLS